jgi:hypothetical protein
MEDYLSSVQDVMTEATGEEGLGAKITSNVQDCMSLDAIKRMQAATEIIPVTNAMEEHLSHKGVCSCGVDAILKIWKIKGNQACSAELVLAGNVVEIVLTCMENHAEAANIQKAACEVLVRLVENCDWIGGVRTLHESPRGINTIIAAVQRYPEDIGVQEAAMSIFFPLQQCELMTPNGRGRYEVFLVNAGGIPLLFSALELHNTSYEVVIGALTAINNIGAQDGLATHLFNYSGCFRIIDDAEITMARMYPDDIYVAREVWFIRMRLQQLRL